MAGMRPDRLLRRGDLVQCRIEVSHDLGRLVVRLAGRLSEAHVAAFLELCAGEGLPPRIELDELVSADAVGLDALLRVEKRGAELVGLAEYLRFKLDDLARAP